MTPHSAERRSGGFTLVELMLVVVIGIILAAAAIPVGTTFADQQVAGDARVLASDFDFARARAIATSQPHRLLFDTVREYYTVESPPGTLLAEPLTKKPWRRAFASTGGGGTDVLSVDFNGLTSVTFDASGRPTSAGSVILKRGKFTATVNVIAITGDTELVLP